MNFKYKCYYKITIIKTTVQRETLKINKNY